MGSISSSQTSAESSSIRAVRPRTAWTPQCAGLLLLLFKDLGPLLVPEPGAGRLLPTVFCSPPGPRRLLPVQQFFILPGPRSLHGHLEHLPDVFFSYGDGRLWLALLEGPRCSCSA